MQTKGYNYKAIKDIIIQTYSFTQRQARSSAYRPHWKGNKTQSTWNVDEQWENDEAYGTVITEPQPE
jgi:hypothetical protein